jgi:Cu/Ag efflux protein CusF
MPYVVPVKKGKNRMKRVFSFAMAPLLLGALAAGLTGCASESARMASAPTAVPATAQPETVVGEAYAETEATIEAIDSKTRTVTLRAADGRTQPVQAPADVDLSALKKGDVVILGAYQRVSVKALPPGAAPLGVTREVAAARSQPGETPGRAVAEATRVVSEVAAIDLANNQVTLKGADGSAVTLDVMNPENQRKLQTLKVGDLVEMDFIEAVGVELKPRS